ncbi:MAG: cysteine desulfurase NifS [Chloroflexi bacterium]|nr:cysteine desulfurase NifS [Chloroflexota bacterium]
MKRVYLDYAATTPVDPDVVTAMLPYYTDTFGNPSSIHGCGQEARSAVAEARTQVAALIGARDEEIVFTGSGTEADNTALVGVAYALEKKGNHIITSVIEHHAILETCKFLEGRGFAVTYLPVDRYGVVSPESVKNAITPKTVLVSVMHANNEIGSIEPIAEISKITREAGVYLHTDAVQTVGHIPVNVRELGVDLLSLSAHKLYGPKGVGALYLRRGTKLVPLIHGGGQERGRRSSTENVAGIAGLGKAAEMARREMPGEIARLAGFRDSLTRGILDGIDHTYLNGHPVNRLPNNVNISVEYIEGESMCLNLDLAGICSSTGSACSSGSVEPSHVLLALGMPAPLAHGSLRFTMGRQTSPEDVDYLLATLPRVVAKLRDMSPLLKRK